MNFSLNKYCTPGLDSNERESSMKDLTEMTMKRTVI